MYRYFKRWNGTSWENVYFYQPADSILYSNTNVGAKIANFDDFIDYAETEYSRVGHTHSQYLTGITKSMVTTALGYTPPTTDTNTTYSAGTGISLDGTTFKVTEAKASEILNQLSTGSSDPVDNDYFISQYAGGGSTTTTYHRRPVSKLYNYIKGKTDNLYLGLSGGNISGHLYLTGANSSVSTGNTSQIVFGTSSNNHVAITSNKNAIIINPAINNTTGQIVLMTGSSPYIRVGSDKYVSFDGHTHNYAGASSAGGAANSAKVLNSGGRVNSANVTYSSNCVSTILSSSDMNEGKPNSDGHIQTFFWDWDGYHSQIFVPNSVNNRISYRTKSDSNGANWTSWKEVANLNDIPTTLPASDVYAWAKNSTKPSYLANEIVYNGSNASITVYDEIESLWNGKSSTSHNHDSTYLKLTGGTMTNALTLTSQSSVWNENNIKFTSGGTIGGNTGGDIGLKATYTMYFRIGSTTEISLDASKFYPSTDKGNSLGSSSYQWNAVYGATIYENGTSLANKYAAKTHNHSSDDINYTDMTLTQTISYMYDGIDFAKNNLSFTSGVNQSASNSGYLNICYCTESQYNSFTKRANTLYLIH